MKTEEEILRGLYQTIFLGKLTDEAWNEVKNIHVGKIAIQAMHEWHNQQQPAMSEEQMEQVKATANHIFQPHMEPNSYWYPNRAVIEIQRAAYVKGVMDSQPFKHAKQPEPVEDSFKAILYPEIPHEEKLQKVLLSGRISFYTGSYQFNSKELDCYSPKNTSFESFIDHVYTSLLEPI